MRLRGRPHHRRHDDGSLRLPGDRCHERPGQPDHAPVRERRVQIDIQAASPQNSPNNYGADPPGLVDLLVRRDKLELDTQPKTDREHADDEHHIR